MKASKKTKKVLKSKKRIEQEKKSLKFNFDFNDRVLILRGKGAGKVGFIDDEGEKENHWYVIVKFEINSEKFGKLEIEEYHVNQKNIILETEAIKLINSLLK